LNERNGSYLTDNIDKIHTTPMGAERIKRHLNLQIDDVVAWCKEFVAGADVITSRGKNWYAYGRGVVLTINAHSFTVITAHLDKAKICTTRTMSPSSHEPFPERPQKLAAIGCCGIDCGLCPRFHTVGSSRCPGCGGEGFEKLHPSCSFKTCCADKHRLEVCGQCGEYPCPKYADREKIERDSFVTHKRMFHNLEQIKNHGTDSFIAQQKIRVAVLQDLLAHYDDGRSKGFYCLAAALLPPEQLKAAMTEAANEDDRKKKAQRLRASLQKCAASAGMKLSLSK